MSNLVHRNQSLLHYNTFGVAAKAKYMAAVSGVEDLRTILSDEGLQKEKLLVLGGGSNILFTQDYDGLVVRNELRGITKVKEDDTHIWVEAQGGEVWHDLVLHCLDQGWYGIENLSLIPGSVGAAPIQNIGAYGVELKDVFHSLQALNLNTLEVHTFNATECEFGYRNSIFKQQLKGEFFILSVVLKLNKQPNLNLSYGAIKQTIDEQRHAEITPKIVSDVVCQIRQSKLPDPSVIGNCGSFFKNAVVPKKQFEELKEEYPNMPHYAVDTENEKIPTGWLIEQCGWKGKRVGNTGAYKNQALVLVNHGGATGAEVKQLALNIQQSVKDRFNIPIEFEVNVI